MKLFSQSLAALSCAALAAGCSVRLTATTEDPVTSNQCRTDGDCGSGAVCTAGTCFTQVGQIDDVLLEIVPDATSSSVGGLTFLSPQGGASRGNRDLEITLKPASFSLHVQVDADDLPPGCPYAGTTPESIQATVEFARGSTSGGFSISSLSKAPVSVDTRLFQSNWVRTVALAPGIYDIYVQPKSTANCPLPPKMLRGVEVKSGMAASAPPATITLPKALTLQGAVSTNDRHSSSEVLAGWQVDIIEPLDGRVISTTWSWPQGSALPSPTNFSIVYQPVTVAGSSSSQTSNVASNSPILRMRPPDAQTETAPTVYWALSAIDLDGDGSVNLDLSGLPSSSQLVNVTGHVSAASGEGVAATVQFLSSSLDGTKGLIASFNRFVTADATGTYTAALYPGQYRMVAAPNPDRNGGLAGNATSSSTIATKGVTVEPGSSPPANITLSARPVVVGRVSAGFPPNPALGATVQALPVISLSPTGVWRSALAQTPIVPDAASVAVNDIDGSFTMSLDPGTFDISVRPGDGSNFGWWVYRLEVTLADPGPLKAHLPFPVPVEGTLDDGAHPLANAVIRAYAKVPGGSDVTKVGDTRTDMAGHYVLLLPPSVAP